MPTTAITMAALAVSSPETVRRLASPVAGVIVVLAVLVVGGLFVGLGTDGAASNNDLNMWEEMDTAAKLHKLISGDPKVMSAEQAFELATIGGAGALLLLGGFVASHFVARSMSAPVKKLALDSEENRAERERAEAALASTAEELERSTRYSADASHQLKSPMTVLRIGLESLLEREGFKPEVYEELSTLLHQTRRLTGVIDDLLLLSRMDAGYLQIASTPVNLSQLVDEWLDDLGALPDSPDVKIEKEFPRGLFVGGEKRYTSLIVQNLLENARKYNRAGGRIRVSAHGNGSNVVLTIGNTGRTIPPGENIFERFHHSSSPSAASGHGIGLNLARELARLHGGELRLVRSESDWTEFEVRFSAANGVNAVT